METFGCQPKNRGVSPKSSILIRVFHYFHHPLFLGNTNFSTQFIFFYTFLFFKLRPKVVFFFIPLIHLIFPKSSREIFPQNPHGHSLDLVGSE